VLCSVQLPAERRTTARAGRSSGGSTVRTGRRRARLLGTGRTAIEDAVCATG
jgi:hypothetical protein